MILIDDRNAKRLLEMKRKGAIAIRWHAVLRSDTPVSCALRHGLIYSLKLDPIGHSIPIGTLPPQSAECRCILLPLLRLPRPKDRPAGSFEEFVNGLSPNDQDRLLGSELATRWHQGSLTKADWVDQRE